MQQYILENNVAEKTVKNKAKIFTLQPETIEKYKIKDYHDLYVKVDVLLIADMFDTAEITKNNYRADKEKIRKRL